MLQNKQSYSKQIKINGWCRKIYIEAFLGSWRKQKQTCIQMIYFHFSFSMNNSCLFRNKSADISMKETLSQNACNSSLCMYLLKTRASFSIIETVSKVLISQTCHIDKVSWVGLFLGIHWVCNVSDSLREFHSIYEDNHQFIRKNCLDASCLSRLFFHCKFIHTYVKMSQFIAIVVRRNEKKFHFPISCGCGKNYYLIRLEATKVGWNHNQLLWMRLVCLISHSIYLKSAWKALIPLLWTKSINDCMWKFSWFSQ